jgi:hypothetical protein
MWSDVMCARIARLLVVTVVILAVSACGGSKAPLNYVPAPALQQLTDTIVEGKFVVPPRTFKPFEIVIGPAMSNARLEGTFTASGANHDIEMLLLDEQQFSNWQNRHTFKSTYASGRVTADKVRIDLPSEPGKYFVVFSNRFSIFSNKDVAADLKLRYDRTER